MTPVLACNEGASGEVSRVQGARTNLNFAPPSHVTAEGNFTFCQHCISMTLALHLFSVVHGAS